MRIEVFRWNAYWKAMFSIVYIRCSRFTALPFISWDTAALAVSNKTLCAWLRVISLSRIYAVIIAARDKAWWSETHLTYVNNVSLNHWVPLSCCCYSACIKLVARHLKCNFSEIGSTVINRSQLVSWWIWQIQTREYPLFICLTESVLWNFKGSPKV